MASRKLLVLVPLFLTVLVALVLGVGLASGTGWRLAVKPWGLPAAPVAGSDAGLYEKASARFQLRAPIVSQLAQAGVAQLAGEAPQPALSVAPAAAGTIPNAASAAASSGVRAATKTSAPAQRATGSGQRPFVDVVGLGQSGYALDARFSPAGTEIRMAAVKPAESVVLAEWTGIRLSVAKTDPGESANGAPTGSSTAGGAENGAVGGSVQAEMDLIPRLVTVSGQFNLVDVDALAGTGRERTARVGVSGQVNLSPRATVKAGYELEKPFQTSSSAPQSGDTAETPSSTAGSGLISSTSVGVGYDLSDSVSLAANYKLINFTGGENNAKPRANQEAGAELSVKF